jgi:hypothetical protein
MACECVTYEPVRCSSCGELVCIGASAKEEALRAKLKALVEVWKGCANSNRIAANSMPDMAGESYAAKDIVFQRCASDLERVIGGGL